MRDNANSCILKVDEDRTICKTLLVTLQSEGFETATATTAEEALEKAKSRHFSLVLSDIRLPDLDGIEPCEQ